MNTNITADMARDSVVLKAAGEVEITAGKAEENKLPTFAFHGYTGEAMQVDGFYHPVIVDLAGAELADPMTALMGHDDSIGGIVGQGKATKNEAGIFATGTVMAEDANAQKLINLSKNGFKWQASIGASIARREFLDAGKTATVNGREVSGPLIIARESLVHEISFVRRGADSNTSAAVAASHPTGKVTAMDPKFQAWLEAKGFDANTVNANASQKAFLETQFKAESPAPQTLAQVFAGAEGEQARQQGIATLTANYLAKHPHIGSDGIERVKMLAMLANDSQWDTDRYELELLRASRPDFRTFQPQVMNTGLNTNVLTAAICQAGRLKNHEKGFDDQTLQAAHDQFKGRIGLNQLFQVCASANGFHDRGFSKSIGLECHRAAFGMSSQNDVRAAFSTLNIATILSATANKFLMEGWMATDMTPMRIASIRPVSDLKTITTVSLTGDLQYEELGTGGEIKHGKLNELSYTNQAKTYAKMLAITEDDIINDDLGALTAVPRRLGRGAGLKLNDLFWTEFLALVGANFFGSTNTNINTGAADMTIGGLTATEVIFMNQIDPDSKPLGIMPAILLVPTALKASAVSLMDPQGVMITGESSTKPNVNPFKGRFTVESSPYISNTSYTGYTSTGWWMLADPNELSVIEIAAYQGRVEPTVESAQADFNTLGVQFRGVSRVGVKRQEYRGGVYADGGAS